MTTTGCGWSMCFLPRSGNDPPLLEGHNNQLNTLWARKWGKNVGVSEKNSVCSGSVKVMLLVPLSPQKMLPGSVTHTRLLENQAASGSTNCVVPVAPHVNCDRRHFLSDASSFTAEWMSIMKMYQHGSLATEVGEAPAAQVAALPSGRPAEAKRLIRRIIEEINQLQDGE